VPNPTKPVVPAPAAGTGWLNTFVLNQIRTPLKWPYNQPTLGQQIWGRAYGSNPSYLRGYSGTPVYGSVPANMRIGAGPSTLSGGFSASTYAPAGSKRPGTWTNQPLAGNKPWSALTDAERMSRWNGIYLEPHAVSFGGEWTTATMNQTLGAIHEYRDTIAEQKNTPIPPPPGGGGGWGGGGGGWGGGSNFQASLVNWRIFKPLLRDDREGYKDKWRR